MAFPTTLDSFPSATTLAAQDLSSTPHSTLHGNLGNAVAALEAKLGVDSSAVTTTIDYKINHLAGDVTGTVGTTTIAAGAVTLAKMANLAANSFIGNNTVSPAVPAALTQQQAADLLAGAVTNNQVLAGNGTHVTLRALVAADLPSLAGLDTTALHQANNLSDLASASTSKTNLKVGYTSRMFAHRNYG